MKRIYPTGVGNRGSRELIAKNEINAQCRGTKRGWLSVYRRCAIPFTTPLIDLFY